MAHEIDPIELLDTKQAAARLNRSHWTLVRERQKKTGLPWIKLGNSVRYRAIDIAAYLAANTVTPGRQGTAANNTAVAPVVRDSRSIPPHLRGLRGFR